MENMRSIGVRNNLVDDAHSHQLDKEADPTRRYLLRELYCRLDRVATARVAYNKCMEW
jgi:hypothetical protein